MSSAVLGWQPLLDSWLSGRRQSEAVTLQPLLAKLIPPMLDFVGCARGLSGKGALELVLDGRGRRNSFLPAPPLLSFHPPTPSRPW